MPRLKLTKSAIDLLPTPTKDIVYWDSGCPRFTASRSRQRVAGSSLCSIGPVERDRDCANTRSGRAGRVTLHQARAVALKIFAARTDGRDPAAEKQQARRRLVIDRVEDLVELFITDHLSKTRSAREISRLLRREVSYSWGTWSVMGLASDKSSIW